MLEYYQTLQQSLIDHHVKTFKFPQDKLNLDPQLQQGCAQAKMHYRLKDERRSSLSYKKVSFGGAVQTNRYSVMLMWANRPSKILSIF
jgi:hypothetical protein